MLCVGCFTVWVTTIDKLIYLLCIQTVHTLLPVTTAAACWIDIYCGYSPSVTSLYTLCISIDQSAHPGTRKEDILGVCFLALSRRSEQKDLTSHITPTALSCRSTQWASDGGVFIHGRTRALCEAFHIAPEVNQGSSTVG